MVNGIPSSEISFLCCDIKLDVIVIVKIEWNLERKKHICQMIKNSHSIFINKQDLSYIVNNVSMLDVTTLNGAQIDLQLFSGYASNFL